SHLLIKFIIKFVQPLYIFQDKDFHEFVHGCELGFRISCDKTAKKLIYEAYSWSISQLCDLLSNTAISVHLTTDLWTARSNYRYIGVTATWLSPEFKFYEVLLICNVLDYLHTSQIISEELHHIIQH